MCVRVADLVISEHVRVHVDAHSFTSACIPQVDSVNRVILDAFKRLLMPGFTIVDMLSKDFSWLTVLEIALPRSEW